MAFSVLWGGTYQIEQEVFCIQVPFQLTLAEKLSLDPNTHGRVSLSQLKEFLCQINPLTTLHQWVWFFLRGLERRLYFKKGSPLNSELNFHIWMRRHPHASRVHFIWELRMVCIAELIITVSSYSKMGEFRSPAHPVPSLHTPVWLLLQELVTW